MYLLTIRDGLQTRHIGPFPSPAAAAAGLEQILAGCGERAHWQIHELESPQAPSRRNEGPPDPATTTAVASGGVAAA